MRKPATAKEITIKALADIANLTPQRIYQLAAEGRLPSINDGKLPRDESISALFKFYQRDSEELKREKLLLVTANRELKEQELSITRGKYVERATARNSICAYATKYHAFVKSELDRNLPIERNAKLLELGFDAALAGVFLNWDLEQAVEVITKIEKLCANAGKETI